jgi:hypothetical protein
MKLKLRLTSHTTSRDRVPLSSNILTGSLIERFCTSTSELRHRWVWLRTITLLASSVFYHGPNRIHKFGIYDMSGSFADKRLACILQENPRVLSRLQLDFLYSARMEKETIIHSVIPQRHQEHLKRSMTKSHATFASHHLTTSRLQELIIPNLCNESCGYA